MRVGVLAPVVAAAVVLAAAAGSVIGAAQSLPNDGWTSGPNPPTPPASSGGSVTAGSVMATAQSAAEQAVRSWVPILGADAPAWLKRTEVTGGLQHGGKPDFSILTVQPLYQSAGQRDTVFVQASQLRYALFGDYRNTTNLGFGYRRLLLDDTLLLGGNTFYDREWTYGHQRIGFGAEAMWHMLEFRANDYTALTHDRSVATDTVERAMNGWDSELRSKIPYLPWASIGLQRYVWTGDYSSVKGWAYTVDMDLTPNVTMQVGSRTAALPGVNDGTSAGANVFASISFHFGDSGRPTASRELVADAAFDTTRDLRTHTLDKVQRENRIMVERTVKTNGISVVVGRSG